MFGGCKITFILAVLFMFSSTEAMARTNFSENFDGVTVSALPADWTVMHSSSANSDFATTTVEAQTTFDDSKVQTRSRPVHSLRTHRASVKWSHHNRNSVMHRRHGSNSLAKRVKRAASRRKYRRTHRMYAVAGLLTTRNPSRLLAKRFDEEQTLDAMDDQGLTPRTDEAEGDPEDRMNWFMFPRTYPFKEIPDGARRRAFEYTRNRTDLHGPEAVGTVWAPIGPLPTTSAFPNNGGFTSGRINSIAVSPANNQIVLVGSATGGIWRSTNGGTNFVPVSDNQVDLAVGSIAFAPSNPNIVYAGMGDNDNGYFGTGVLKSTDAGATWARINNTTFPDRGQCTKVVVDPADPNRVYVAQFNSLNPVTGGTFVSGIYVSTDGGVAWTRTLSGSPSDLAIHPTNPQIVYAGVRFSFAQTPSQGLYRSTDAGMTWNKVFDSPYNAAFSSTREFRVSVTPAAPNRVYIYFGTRATAPAEARLEMSNDSGLTWTNRGVIQNDVGGIDSGQFGYNTYMEASPTEPNTVYVGSRDTFRSTDSGVTFTNVANAWAPPYPGNNYQPRSQAFHSDQQSFAFQPGSGSIIYCGNDGGLWKSTDSGNNFTSLNATLSLTQFTSLATDPTDAARTYGGTQDNGTQRRLTGTTGWKEEVPISGDGGRVVVNPLNPAMIYASYINGSITRMVGNGATFSGAIANAAVLGGDPPRIAFYPPIVGNGVDARLYVGTFRLFICDNCNDENMFLPGSPPNWTAPGGTFDQTTGVGDVLSALAVARSNVQVIYSGSRNGRAMVSTNGGVNWTDITAGLPTRSISSITVDPANPNRVFLTVSGYGTGHVFGSTDGGTAWTDLSANLPNIPTSAFVIDPMTAGVAYAGTDIGVFRLGVDGQWTAFNNGIPPVPVMAFTSQANGLIQVATYGRGAYELTPTGPPPVTIADASGPSGPGASAPSGANAPTNNSFDFAVTRTGDVSGVSTVHYTTVDGTATVAHHNYEPASGTLTFAAGETRKDVFVLIDSNDGVEPDETFTVHLDTPINASVTHADGVGTIINTGVSPTTFQGFSSTAFVGDEGRSATITLSRTGDTAGSSSVKFNTVVGGTATGGASCVGGADYQTVTGQTVTFGQNVVSQTVTIPVCSDRLSELPETVNLNLTEQHGGGLSTYSTAVLTINDTANQYVNTAPINMMLGGPSDLYPSPITVSNAPASVFRIRVTLYGVSQTLPDNMKVLLVGPNGAKYVLMGDAGGATPINPIAPVTLTFTDGAAAVLPDSTPLTTGKFLPTTWGPVGDFFPPAPGGPYVLAGSIVARPVNQTMFGNFGLVSGNGVWNLYIRDDNGGQRPFSATPTVASGSIAGGWGIELLASATVSGRVLTPDGRGLRNATVRITDRAGVTRIATTSSFGFYQFDDSALGETYTIGVVSRLYRFASRTVDIADPLTALDFTGQE